MPCLTSRESPSGGKSYSLGLTPDILGPLSLMMFLFSAARVDVAAAFATVVFSSYSTELVSSASSSISTFSSSTSIDKLGCRRRSRRRFCSNNQCVLMATPSHLAMSSSMDDDDESYNDDRPTENIPRTGYSLADRMENSENVERFGTTLTPIANDNISVMLDIQYDVDGFPIGYHSESSETTDGNWGVARIDTVSSLGNAGEEPVRWLISMGEKKNFNNNDSEDMNISYAMIDLPPYSDTLADEMRIFMDRGSDQDNDIINNNVVTKRKGNLDVILITNGQCIHYDKSPGVYVTRKSDLTKWTTAFPNANVIMYRLDIPRDCREVVTQVLDGYGPWGYTEENINDKRFVETGRPLTIEEWDDDTKSRVLTRGETPPDDIVLTTVEDNGNVDDDNNNDDEGQEDGEYSSDAIRKREDAYRLLAVYTPGHTFGSVSYVFPQRGICCSGYALPLDSSSGDIFDDDHYDDGDGNGGVIRTLPPPRGPRLDYQGYLATSASQPRQMSSALSLIDNYIDRFRVVLPARGDAVFLDAEVETRKRELMDSVGLYKKIGDIYSRLGIVE